MKLFHVLYRQQCVNEHEQVAQRDSFNCVFFQVRLTWPLRLDDLTNLVGGWWVGMVEEFRVLPFKMRFLPIKMEFKIRKELLDWNSRMFHICLWTCTWFIFEVHVGNCTKDNHKTP